MEPEQIDELRSRIASEIGRDKDLILSGDKARHFVGADFVVQYGGELFLLFATAAGTYLWEKIKDRAAKAGKQAANSVWTAVAKKLSGAPNDAEHETDAKQVAHIKDVDKGLQQLGTELESAYIEDFLRAGQGAVEARLRRDHFSDAKARRIAAAVAREVKQRVASGHV